jgi:hypothetical protein
MSFCMRCRLNADRSIDGTSKLTGMGLRRRHSGPDGSIVTGTPLLTSSTHVISNVRHARCCRPAATEGSAGRPRGLGRDGQASTQIRAHRPAVSSFMVSFVPDTDAGTRPR